MHSVQRELLRCLFESSRVVRWVREGGGQESASTLTSRCSKIDAPKATEKKSGPHQHILPALAIALCCIRGYHCGEHPLLPIIRRRPASQPHRRPLSGRGHSLLPARRLARLPCGRRPRPLFRAGCRRPLAAAAAAARCLLPPDAAVARVGPRAARPVDVAPRAGT